MIVDVLQLVAGCALLYFGAEWLIAGAAGLARTLGIRPLVIGLTVVAYGTSMPELVVSSVAALEERGGIAFGNVVGSNIANIGLILGITALISPPRVEGGLMRRELPVLLLTTAALPALLVDDLITRAEGALLLGGALLFTIWVLRGAKPGEVSSAAIAESDADAAGAPSVAGRGKQTAVALGGLALLIAGGKIFVNGATGAATALGISERIIGLTIVAVGTSLPELAASVIAAVRGHSSIAVGNVVGSNIFNVLFILGGSSVLRPLAVPLDGFRSDIFVLAIATCVAIVLLRTSRSLTRVEGAVLVGCYAAFLAVLPAL